MGIIDWIFPKMCVGCRREGEYICECCRKRMVSPVAICPMCCKPSIDGWTHPRCRSRFGMERLIVGLQYRGPVQQCLKKVKYKSSWDMIRYLYKLGSFGEIEDSIVTSVPMWSTKERMRGFNQAEIVAELVAKANKVTNLVLLERVRETKPMFGLTRKARLKNIEGAFKLLNHLTITPMNQRVVLVDDVWTTGATMRECARVLKEAGTCEVWGVALGR